MNRIASELSSINTSSRFLIARPLDLIDASKVLLPSISTVLSSLEDDHIFQDPPSSLDLVFYWDIWQKLQFSRLALVSPILSNYPICVETRL